MPHQPYWHLDRPTYMSLDVQTIYSGIQYRYPDEFLDAHANIREGIQTGIQTDLQAYIQMDLQRNLQVIL